MRSSHKFVARCCHPITRTRLQRGLLWAGFGLLSGIWALGLSGLQFERLKEPEGRSSVAISPHAWELKGPTENFRVDDDALSIANQPDENSSAQYRLSLLSPGSDRWIEFTGVLDSNLNTSNHRPALHASWFIHEFSEKRVGVDLHTDLTQRLTNERTSHIRKIPPDVHAVVVSFLIRDSLGEITIKAARIEILKQSAIFNVLAGVLTVLVVLWLAWLSLRMLSGVPLLYRMVALLTFVTLVAGATLSERLIEKFIRPAITRVFVTSDYTSAPSMENLFDAGHGLVFFILGIIVLQLWLTGQERLRHCVVLLMIFALGTEGLQLFLPHRHPSLSDIGVNSAGIMLALLVIMVVRYSTNDKSARKH